MAWVSLSKFASSLSFGHRGSSVNTQTFTLLKAVLEFSVQTCRNGCIKNQLSVSFMSHHSSCKQDLLGFCHWLRGISKTLVDGLLPGWPRKLSVMYCKATQCSHSSVYGLSQDDSVQTLFRRRFKNILFWFPLIKGF